MSARGFLALLVVTAIALLAAVALVVSEQIDASNDRGAGGLVFPDLDERIADVTQVAIEARRYSMTLERRNGSWVAIDRGDYPVRSQPIDQLLAGMVELVEYEPKTANPELYAELGVAGPSEDREDTLVTITAANGDVLADVILGYPANAIGQHTRGGMYLRRTDEERAWLAEGTVLPPTFPSEFFDPLFSISGRDVGRLTIFSGEEMLFDAVKVDFDTSDYELEYLDPSFGVENAIADDSGVRGMSQAIVSTTFQDARTVESVSIPEDARTVRYVTQDGLSLSATLAEADGETWVVYEATAEPGSAAEEQAAEIAAATDGWAFRLGAGRIITFNRDVTELYEIGAPPVDPEEDDVGDGPLLPLN